MPDVIDVIVRDLAPEIIEVIYNGTGTQVEVIKLLADSQQVSLEGVPGRPGVDGTDGTDGQDGAPGPQGERGPPGPAGGVPYVHDQSAPSAVWTIVHNRQTYPSSVTTVDTANQVVFGDVDYTDLDTVVVTFGSAFSGKAYLL
jgi:hypothetical protein